MHRVAWCTGGGEATKGFWGECPSSESLTLSVTEPGEAYYIKAYMVQPNQPNHYHLSVGLKAHSKTYFGKWIQWNDQYAGNPIPQSLLTGRNVYSSTNPNNGYNAEDQCEINILVGGQMDLVDFRKDRKYDDLKMGQ